MDEENSSVKIDAGVGRDDGSRRSASPGSSDHGKRLRLWVNWVLALLTGVGAAGVMFFSFGAVMSTAACSDKQCPTLGPRGISFDVLFYGAPVVAALTIVISIFTARRRWGIAVPICALALLIADVTILAVTVAQ
jgi:hypothetical protein